MTRPVKDQSLSIITHGVPTFGKYQHQRPTQQEPSGHKKGRSPQTFPSSTHPLPGKGQLVRIARNLLVGTGAKPLARSETKKTHAVPTPQGSFPSDHDWLSLLLTPGYGYEENRLT